MSDEMILDEPVTPTAPEKILSAGQELFEGKVVVDTTPDLTAQFKARMEAFKPSEPSEDKPRKHMSGNKVAEIMKFERRAGTFASGDGYDDISLGIRIEENGSWIFDKFSMIDKKNMTGEVYRTASSEFDRLLNALHFMDCGLHDLDKLEEVCTGAIGKKIFVKVKAAYNPPTVDETGKQVFSKKFDNDGFPVHKFSVMPIPPDMDDGAVCDGI